MPSPGSIRHLARRAGPLLWPRAAKPVRYSRHRLPTKPVRTLVALTVALSTASAVVSQAVFVESAMSAGNSFSTTTLATPTGLVATTTGSTVNLSWSATVSTKATGHRVFRATVAGGPYAQIAQIAGRSTVTYADVPGVGTFYYVVRSYYAANGADWFSVNSNQAQATVAPQPYVFKSTAGGTTTGCPAAQRHRDMEQGFVPTDSEETISRAGGTGTITFCSPALTAGRVLAAGTTTVSAYFRNTSGSSCTVTATVYLNGTTALGSGSVTIPAASALSVRSWSFNTTGATLTGGARISLHLVWAGVKACDTIYLHYDGQATNSRIQLPDISAL